MFAPETSCFGGMVAERGIVERVEGAGDLRVPK
jgi:hypothetical protein